MTEIIYEIQARQSLRLTEISRALGERVSFRKNVERLRGDRSLESGSRQSALMMAQDCPALFMEYVAKEESDQERPLRLEVGYRKVRLPGRMELLTLVVVKGFSAEPLILMTNLSIKRSRKSLWHVVAAYMNRWRLEETIRFLKQSYQFEDFRLQTYVRLLKPALPPPKPHFVQRFLFDI
jgi:hypothetical protein